MYKLSVFRGKLKMNRHNYQSEDPRLAGICLSYFQLDSKAKEHLQISNPSNAFQIVILWNRSLRLLVTMITVALIEYIDKN